MSRDLQ